MFTRKEQDKIIEIAKRRLEDYFARLVAGKVPVSQLGSGSPDGSKFLADAGEWATPSGGGQAFPIGSIFLAVVATDPATLLGYGTWSQIAQGQFLVGQKATDTDFDVVEETGGAKTINIQHQHGVGALVNSTVTGSRKGGTSGAATLTDSHLHTITGATDNQLSTTQSILPPYFTIYCWKRTA